MSTLFWDHERSVVERIETTSTMAEHVYCSTACEHRLHDQCRLRCKFCDAPCSCLCHEKRRQ